MLTITAEDETDANKLYELMNPVLENKNYMGDVYNSTLGYNPLDVFDRYLVSCILKKYENLMPENIRSRVQCNESDIINDIMTIRKDVDEDLLEGLIVKYITIITGWEYMGDNHRIVSSIDDVLLDVLDNAELISLDVGTVEESDIPMEYDDDETYLDDSEENVLDDEINLEDEEVDE